MAGRKCRTFYEGCLLNITIVIREYILYYKITIINYYPDILFDLSVDVINSRVAKLVIKQFAHCFTLNVLWCCSDTCVCCFSVNVTSSAKKDLIAEEIS